jgi:uncharacterized Zn-finger protein
MATHATATTATAPRAVVTVQAQDLQGPGVVFCPNPKMPLWSNHPRVFIDVASQGEGACPYCGTVYKLAGGARAGGH